MNCRPTVITAFDDRDEAQLAVDELEQAGFPSHEIGFAIRGTDAVQGGMITDAEGTHDAEGAAKGAAAGAAIGGVLGALAFAAIPGVGPVMAGGMLAGLAGGAAAGAATGGIYGAMSGLGASEEEAVFYQREFESGKAIVTVCAGERRAEAENILHRHGGYEPSMHH
ncbi:MAG TPA: general stress protein [Tepidisphaeraceae bacterium]|nr:general stress protein [Tepidisphaeraceae bacterium]